MLHVVADLVMERAFVVAWALCAVPLFFLSRFQQVDVGADGISLSWNGRRRFLVWENLRAVEPIAHNRLRIAREAEDEEQAEEALKQYPTLASSAPG